MSDSPAYVVKRRSEESERQIQLLSRLVACLAGGMVLALMVGNQEGTQQDFYYEIKQSWAFPRVLVFLLIGLALFLLITFFPRVKPFLTRPGLRPLAVGVLTVVSAFALLKWTDSTSTKVGTGKFGDLARAARETGALSAPTRLFFGSAVSGTPWLLLLVLGALAFAAVALRHAILGYVVAVLAVLAGIWAAASQRAVTGLLNIPDHATGGVVALFGFLTIAAAALTAARSRAAEANGADLLDRVVSWRPAMPAVVLAAVLGLFGLFEATWFSPQHLSPRLADMASTFQGQGLSALSTAYFGWLGYVLFLASLAATAWASYRRDRLVAYASALLGLVGMVLTLVTASDYGGIGAAQKFDGAKTWTANQGVGPWSLAAAFLLLGGAGYLVVRHTERARGGDVAESSDSITNRLRHPGEFAALTGLVLITAALFYPPTASQFWQTVLVTEIGIYVLLAVGLNVVVGWAGLLDLGFIAFYAIGSYATAYFTGRLPVKPPFELTPLQVIPFAIAACLVAGVALGAPTLRLRGDYLAIVTLGFGEIIRQVSNILTPVTNGPRGAFNIPSPSIHLGPIHYTWGNSVLGYWYLLLVLTMLVVFLFNRLEHSRIGRAWAAIREDETAAQATGINTTRTKLLAFAIGASTSGLAGVFFSSQIGSFTPENFVLNNSILVVAYVVFGGMGSLAGAMAGAAVLTWLPEFLKDQVPAEDRQMWIGTVIMLMMIFRPAGLIPARRRAAELRGLNRPSTAEPPAVPAAEGM